MAEPFAANIFATVFYSMSRSSELDPQKSMISLRIKEKIWNYYFHFMQFANLSGTREYSWSERKETGGVGKPYETGKKNRMFSTRSSIVCRMRLRVGSREFVGLQHIRSSLLYYTIYCLTPSEQ